MLNIRKTFWGRISFLVGETISLLALLVMVGCAKHPAAEIADAEAALAAAKLAEADVYVPDEYKSAEDLLAQARFEAAQEKEKWFKNYDTARKTAIKSRDKADAAAENAKAAKARAKAEAEGIISQLKTALQEAKAAGAETYFADEMARLNRTLSEVEADYNAEKYLDAISKGREAIAQAKDLTAKTLAKKEAEERRRKEALRRKDNALENLKNRAQQQINQLKSTISSAADAINDANSVGVDTSSLLSELEKIKPVVGEVEAEFQTGVSAENAYKAGNESKYDEATNAFQSVINKCQSNITLASNISSRAFALAKKARSKPQSHQVVRGECLWRIAELEKVYSDPFQWPLIYQENRTKIKDPDLIYPRQEFDIKRNANSSEIRQAIDFAKTRGPWSLFDGK